MTELRDLREQLRELVDRRLLAREHIQGALAEIERSLVEALGGERLRLHQLNGREKQFRGVVLRGRFPDRAFDRCSNPSQVVLRDDGLLLMAQLNGSDEVEVRPIRVEDLDAEDMPMLVDRVLYALQHHTNRVGAMSERYAEISSLAQRVSDALVRRVDPP